jgi:hypothetical protein
MEGIQSCGRASDSPAIEFQIQSARLSCLNVCEEQSTEISIMTDEGDKVMLSAQQHAEATRLTYEHLVYNNAGYDWEEMELADFTLEREIGIALEGELNDQELADIQALLRDLGGMLKAFLTGEVESDGLPEAAGDLSRFGTISGFEADFEYRVSVQYLNFEADPLTVQDAAGPQLTDTPAPAATTAPPVAASIAVLDPAQAAAAPTATAPMPLRGEAEQTAAKMANRVNESGLPPRRLLKLLKKFMKNFLKEMLANQVINTAQAQRGESVLDRFIGEVRRSAGGVGVRMSQASMNLQSVSSLYEAKAEFKLQPTVAETA